MKHLWFGVVVKASVVIISSFSLLNSCLQRTCVKNERFPTFLIVKNVYFIFISRLVLSHSNHFMGSFIYLLSPLILSISCKPHGKVQLSSLLTQKEKRIPLKNDTGITDIVTHTPHLATLTTPRHQDRLRKTLTLTAYDGKMVTKFLPP